MDPAAPMVSLAGRELDDVMQREPWTMKEESPGGATDQSHGRGRFESPSVSFDLSGGRGGGGHADF